MNRGDRVISFSRGHYPELESSGVKQIQGDISSPVAVENAVRGVDTVHHVAAKAGVLGGGITRTITGSTPKEPATSSPPANPAEFPA